MGALEYGIVIFCVAGAAYSGWRTGFKIGAEEAVNVLEDHKIIKYDHNGNIVANCAHNRGEMDILTKLNNALILDIEDEEESNSPEDEE